MVNLFETRYLEPWEHYEFSDALPPSIINYLKSIDQSCFYGEHTEQDEQAGNYDEKNLMYFHPNNPQLVELFTNKFITQQLHAHYNVRPRYVRFTLVDIVGPRDVFCHCDDPEKLVTAQIYITDEDSSKLGTWYYKNHDDTDPAKLVRYRDNCGHVFKPQDNITWHSLPTVTNVDVPRRSLLINYTDTPTKWKINQYTSS